MDQKEVVKKANAWATHNAEWKTKMPELRKIIASGKRPKGSVPPGFSEVGKKKAKVGSSKKPAHKAEAKAAKAMVSMGFSNPYPKKMQVTPREKISKNSDEFSGSDFIGTISLQANSNPGDILYITNVRPTNHVNTRLFYEAQLWEKWDIISWQYVLAPLKSKMYNGNCISYVDTDPVDTLGNSPNNLAIAIAHSGAVPKNIFEKVVVSVPKDRRYTDLFVSPQTGDQRLWSAGNFRVVYGGGAPAETTVIYHVYIHYKVRFRIRQLHVEAGLVGNSGKLKTNVPAAGNLFNQAVNTGLPVTVTDDGIEFPADLLAGQNVLLEAAVGATNNTSSLPLEFNFFEDLISGNIIDKVKEKLDIPPDLSGEALASFLLSPHSTLGSIKIGLKKDPTSKVDLANLISRFSILPSSIESFKDPKIYHYLSDEARGMRIQSHDLNRKLKMKRKYVSDNKVALLESDTYDGGLGYYENTISIPVVAPQTADGSLLWMLGNYFSAGTGIYRRKTKYILGPSENSNPRDVRSFKLEGTVGSKFYVKWQLYGNTLWNNWTTAPDGAGYLNSFDYTTSAIGGNWIVQQVNRYSTGIRTGSGPVLGIELALECASQTSSTASEITVRMVGLGPNLTTGFKSATYAMTCTFSIVALE